MEIREIADGTITIEMQPEEAMDLARACERMSGLPFDGDAPKDRLYRTYHALFEALAVAGNAQYSILGDDDLADSTLTALRATRP